MAGRFADGPGGQFPALRPARGRGGLAPTRRPAGPLAGADSGRSGNLPGHGGLAGSPGRGGLAGGNLLPAGLACLGNLPVGLADLDRLPAGLAGLDRPQVGPAGLAGLQVAGHLGARRRLAPFFLPTALPPPHACGDGRQRHHHDQRHEPVHDLSPVFATIPQRYPFETEKLCDRTRLVNARERPIRPKSLLRYPEARNLRA
uniref:Uncharacterized protein n=1 Tax=Thermocrispum agreste TaxID=37925 RepID=A0A2W4JL72_9PSEU|nr:MAG: hypothetical protein DIU77_06815 [Thermocrispum agreste]